MTQIIFDSGFFTALGNDRELAVITPVTFFAPRLRGARFAFFYVPRGIA